MYPLHLVNNKPKSFSLEITRRCPLNCMYCNKKNDLTKDMDLDTFTKLKEKIDTIDGVERIVFCGIGETFLHKDINTYIGMLENYKISLITSGTLKIDFEKLLDNKNIDLFIVSVDATSEESIRKICGESFNYNNFINNLEDISKWSKHHGNKDKKVLCTVMNCTINEENKNKIVELVDFASKYKFVCLHYSLPWGEDDFIRSNAPELTKEFSKAIKNGVRQGIFIENPFKSYCCVNFNSILPYINIHGDVFPCGYGLNINYKVGNIFQDDFNTIWDKEEYRNFREGTLCKDCHMMNFDRLKKEGELVEGKTK